MTLIQKITFVLILLYLSWEVYVQFWWMKTLRPNDPVIRVDLVLFLPILAIFIGVSLSEYYKSRRGKG